jgi:predicted membrane chloride channel (bestrophin family)
MPRGADRYLARGSVEDDPRTRRSEDLTTTTTTATATPPRMGAMPVAPNPSRDVPPLESHPLSEGASSGSDDETPRSPATPRRARRLASDRQTGGALEDGNGNASSLDPPPASGPGGDARDAAATTSRRARCGSAASVDSVISSVGSVGSGFTTEDEWTGGGPFPGAPGLGGGLDADRRRRKSRRATRARDSGFRGASAKRVVLLDKPREMERSRFAFAKEIFRLKDTIVPRVVPQVIAAALVGLVANVVKIRQCGEDITDDTECDVTFNLDGHLGVSVVLSFLLVFRADLAWKRYEQGKAALGAVHGGIRNLNVAAAVFLRRRARDETKTKTKTNGDDEDEDDYDDDDALASDRAEIFRLTNLLYAFVRHAARGQRHGYSDVGPVTDDELLTRDRGGKPRVPDLFLNPEEAREFKALDAWNRPNLCASLISDIVEHRRRVGSLGERAAMDAFRDLRVVLDALKSMERIVTTPIPYQYLHMLNVLLFFFVYSVPFVFTANFKWVTPFPSAVVALAFYGVNEIGRCMEDPFSWEEPCHDLSAVGWRSYRENAQIHADADDAAAKEAKPRDAYHGNGRARAESGHSVVSGLADNSRDAAARYFTSDDDARSTTASEGERDTRKRRDTLRFFGDVSGTDVDDGDDDDSAATVDPGMLPKELSTHWTGFIAEIFVFRDTVMPTLLPQIVVAFALGLAAQIVKMRACGADVVAAAECQTTFDITGHQVVSVSLGFLLVFRTDWAYDRYYEGKASLGQLYGGMRNLNVLFVNFLRENRPGECAAFARAARTSNVDGRLDPGANERNLNAGKITARTSHGSAAGTYDERDAERTPAERVEIARRVRRDRAELLRLTNVMYAVMRHALRELRVGRAETGPSSDEECVLEDYSGAPRLPTYLRSGEASKLLSLSPSNRHNWIAMRVQNIVETNRRLGFIGERAAFEIYQELESCLGAYKAMERIVSTPIPFTYLHMLQFILFFFVFSAPFVFATTFRWIAWLPSAIVAVGFYGINEMGKLIQDPFNWQQPCHDLSGVGLRIYRENLKVHENAAAAAAKDASLASNASARADGAAFLKVMQTALERHDSESDIAATSPGNANDANANAKSRSAAKARARSRANSVTSQTSFGSDAARSRSSAKSVFLALDAMPSVNAHGGASESYGEELDSGPLTFFTVLFRYRGTVLPKIMPQTLFAVFVSVLAQVVKIYWCGANITSHSECPLAFSETAHSVAGGIIGFMLVFRTSISYYRFYEGKKYLGNLYDSVRNANIGFNAFMRSSEDEHVHAGFSHSLNRDRVELRRLSSVLYAFIRQAVREHRHGYPTRCDVAATDASLVDDDLFGRPSLGVLLTDAERAEFKALDFNNRANMVVWKMQSIVEHHRRLGHVSDRGAFDIYHDLEGCLEAYKHMERIVSTKMPFQYLHMVNFLLFIFVFSAPFVFTTGFKWLSPIPSCIVAISFYGVAEVARSIEDPYSWVKPCHDLTGVGWRLYAESLQLHEASVADVDAAIANDGGGAFECETPAAAAAADASVVYVGVDATGGAKSAGGAKRVSPGGVRRRVAHGAVDVELLAHAPTVEPSAEAIEVAKARAAAAAKAAQEPPPPPRAPATAPAAAAGTLSGGVPLTHTPLPTPELSSHALGFIFDIFRFKHTIHREVVPQVALAFVIGWAAQIAKLIRCGGHVQEAYECPVTFEPHAHAVVGSVLAFMIVYRFKFAYDRYYEAKSAMGELHCGLRNFNIGVCAFLRDAREGEPGYDGADGAVASARAALLLNERTELLRLSGLLFGFLRHMLREQRLGYPDDTKPGDKQLLMEDRHGAPSLGSLLKGASEANEYSEVPFQNRPNMVVTRIQAIVEHHRRLGHICERGAFDLYSECQLVMSSLKACERVVTTPIPFQYVQICSFVTFLFTYSAPFIFTVSYQYISFFPSCLLAMAFYGINSIGEVIERPFNWTEPNHDIAGVGLRVWRECVQIHERCAEKVVRDATTRDDGGDDDDDDDGDGDDDDGGGGGEASRAARALRDLAHRASLKPDHESLLRQHAEIQRTFRDRRQSAIDVSKGIRSLEYPRHPLAFITGLFSIRHNVLKKVAPQIMLSASVGLFANAAKSYLCGDDVKLSSECMVTFNTEAHAICGAIIGFLLVFCAQISYVKFYEAKTAVGEVYHGIRNMNIAFAAFLRAPAPGEPGHDDATPRDQTTRDVLRADQIELRRLTDVLFAFVRQALREHRHGYSHHASERCHRAPTPIADLLASDERDDRSRGAGAGAGRARSCVHLGGAVAGPVSDADLLREDACGDPTLALLLTADERIRYAKVDRANRFNVVVADVQRLVERRRRAGDVYEKAAFDVYKSCDFVLAAYKSCERIISTPIPYQYVHMVNLVLFVFVFSAPFTFTATFKWLTPVPAAILALGFYGIWEVGKTMMDPFDWHQPSIDLTGEGRRIANEAQRITEAGARRYSLFSPRKK